MPAFYQSEIVRIIPSGSEFGYIIPNVQSVNTSFQIQRRDTMKLGRFAPIKHRQAEQDPLVNVSLEFIPTGSDIYNTLGLMGTGSMIENLMTGIAKWNDAKIQIRELVGGGTSVGTINLRTGVITNYSFNASVGQTPKTSLSMEFLDIGVDASTQIIPPSIDDGNPILRPQDISVDFPTGIFGVSNIYIQSFSFSLPLGRLQVNEIGNGKPVSRELSSPVIASIQIQAIIENFQSTSNISGSSMYNLTCGTPLNDNLVITVKVPSCTGESTETLVGYTVRYPYLDSISIGNSIGGYTSTELQLSCPLTNQNNLNESNVVMF